MHKSILITFIVFTGLFFSSCNNKKSKSDSEEVTKEMETEKEEATPVKKEVVTIDFDEQTVDDELANKIKNYIANDFLTDGDLRAISEEQRKFQLYKVDLNGDGNEEVFVNFITSYFCGTGGCTILLLDSDLAFINSFSPMRTLYVDESSKNDWKVLLTKSEEKWRKLIYEKDAYPSNPTMVEALETSPIEDATILFNEDNSNAKTYSF